MTDEEMLDVIAPLIREIVQEPDLEVRRDVSLADDEFGIDSLSRVELIAHLERRFSVEVPDEQVGKIQTVGDLVDMINALCLR